HAVGVRRVDAVEVKASPDGQLAGEGALRTLAGEPLDVRVRVHRALGADGQRAVLDRDVDRARVSAWQVDAQDIVLTCAVEVHRHGCRSARGTQELVHDPVHLLERLEERSHSALTSLRLRAGTFPVLGAPRTLAPGRLRPQY